MLTGFLRQECWDAVRFGLTDLSFMRLGINLVIR